jgi:hydrogenase maturation protein HypF
MAQLDDLPDLNSPPFSFPERYGDAQKLIAKGVRTFTSSSTGRLFDAAAALLGFAREASFEGQAPMWLEQLARSANSIDAYAFPFDGNELDFRPLLQSVAKDRWEGRRPAEIARAFQRGVACGIAAAVTRLCQAHQIDVAVLSGGVFQNELLLEDLHAILKSIPPAIWLNRAVSPNDGGISLGQAALAAFGRFDSLPPGGTHA